MLTDQEMKRMCVKPHSYILPLIVALLLSCKGPVCCRVLPIGEMREGDLAFRCGQGIISRVVTSAEDNCVYSHVGVLVKTNGEWKIVHAVPGEHEYKGDFDRVRINAPEEFFASGKAFRGCLIHTGLSDSTAIHTISKKAVEAAENRLEFDNEYDCGDSSKTYCTEFVWRLYKDCGIDLSEGRRKSLNTFYIKGEIILPEHLLQYSENKIYYNY